MILQFNLVDFLAELAGDTSTTFQVNLGWIGIWWIDTRETSCLLLGLLIYLPGNYLVILASISVSKIYSHRVLNIVINEHWIWIPPCNWINCSDLMMTSRTWGLVRVPIIIPEWTMFQAGELLQFLQIYYISIKWQLSWLTMINTKTDWWFGTFFTFPYLGNNHPNWRTHSIIFQRAW